MTTRPASLSPLDRLFAALHSSPVTRSSNRVLGGVCAGVAERTGLSVGVVRVLTVVLGIFGPAVLLYLLAWVLLPAADGRIRLEQALRDGDPASIALLVVTALVLLPDALFRPHWAWLPLVGIGVVALLAWRGGPRGGCGGRKIGNHGSMTWGHGSPPRGHGSNAWGHASETGEPGPGAQPGHRDEDGRPQDAPRS